MMQVRHGTKAEHTGHMLVSAHTPSVSCSLTIDTVRSATPLLVIVMVVMFPVFGVIPVIFLGETWRKPAFMYDAGFRYDHRCRLHVHGLRSHHYWRRLYVHGLRSHHHWPGSHDDWRGRHDRDRHWHLNPNADM